MTWSFETASRLRGAALVAMTMFASSVSPGFADPPRLVTENYRIPAADPGIELLIRNKRPADMTNFSADRILLYVHGATYRRRPPSICRSADDR